MNPELLQMVAAGDEVAIERAYFDDACPQFFTVDWREYDDEIVALCAGCLGLPELRAEWRGEALYVIHGGREARVPLRMDAGDRHATVCALNDLLAPGYEIRFLVASHGNDSAGFAVLPAADWRELESANAAFVAENFIDPRTLPNIMTELTDATLPPLARARYERMVERHTRR